MDGQSPNLEELQLNLRQQFSLYTRLVDILREEREHIVAVKLNEIRDCTYTKEALLDEIHREEFRRLRWAKETAAFLKVKESELTIVLIVAKLATPAQSEPLLSLRTALSHMVNKAREMNAYNGRLVEVAIGDAQILKQNILGLSSEKPKTYGPKGQMGNSGRDYSARFLNKDI